MKRTTFWQKIRKNKNNINLTGRCINNDKNTTPRTLQMSVVGIRDMSAIYEPPQR